MASGCLETHNLDIDGELDIENGYVNVFDGFLLNGSLLLQNSQADLPAANIDATASSRGHLDNESWVNLHYYTINEMEIVDAKIEAESLPERFGGNIHVNFP